MYIYVTCTCLTCKSVMIQVFLLLSRTPGLPLQPVLLQLKGFVEPEYGEVTTALKNQVGSESSRPERPLTYFSRSGLWAVRAAVVS